nr:hypothetical protein [Tanacetum cinerariifolium]
MDQDAVHMMTASKVPCSNQVNMSFLWRMRMEQYIQMVDYSLLEVIENGNKPPVTTVVEGVETTVAPSTAEEKVQRRLELKAISTLLIGIPKEHQLKCNSIKDAKSLLQATEKRFRGNAATKKTQRNLLKQQYENFTASSSKVLDQTFDRLQKVISQLEILGESGVFQLPQKGYFVRECRALRNQENKKRESTRRTTHVETHASSALVSCDGLGGYDWSDQAKDSPTNFALMAYSSTSYNFEHIVSDTSVKKPGVESSEAKASEDKPKRVNTVRNKQVNIARPKAVLNAIKGNEVHAFKASACWVWKPTIKILDHVSKHNSALIILKKLITLMHKADPRMLDSGCSRHIIRNMSYLTDYKEIDGGHVAFGGIIYNYWVQLNVVEGVNTPQNREDILKLNELMDLCTSLQKKVLALEAIKTSQAYEIDNLKRRVKKLEKKQRLKTHNLKSLYKGRIINDLDADEDITLVNDQEMFDANKDLQGEEVVVEQEVVADKQPSVDASHVSVAVTNVTIEDITLAKTLEDLKTSKPKIRGIVIKDHEEPSESRITTTISSKKSQDKERMQAEEQELNKEEKAKLFMELLEKRRKFFAAKRAKEKRNKPPTKAQQRSLIEDVETLWRLVKAKHRSTRPEEGYERVLWRDLKVMFDPHVEDKVWKFQQSYKVVRWTLFNCCRVHCLSLQSEHIYLLAEKRCPFTPAIITDMLNKKLHANHFDEMTYQPLKLVTKQLKNK